MTPAEWGLIVGAVSGALVALIGALVTARTSAKKTDLSSWIAKSEQHQEQDSQEFVFLKGENARLEKSLDRRREEWVQVNTDLNAVRKELNDLRVTQAMERATWAEERAAWRIEKEGLVHANALLKERVAQMEKTIQQMTDEREQLIGAMKAAGIQLPELRRRGDTGPLGQASI